MTDIASDRAARLQGDAAEIHVPEPDADREALLVKVGIALPILGLILIGIAWFQASGSKYVADQIPMLISGGVLGLGLILLGAAIWIRYTIARLMRVWLARDLIERQRQTDRIVEALSGRSD